MKFFPKFSCCFSQIPFIPFDFSWSVSVELFFYVFIDFVRFHFNDKITFL